jgi:PAS domain S-box-containing protein
MVETARARAEAALRRDATLEAVAFAAQRFLEERDWEEVVPEVLRRLGRATFASRAYVFQNHRGEDGSLLTSQRWEWVAPDVPREIDNPMLQSLSWQAAGLSRWVRVLGSGAVLQGHVREFPPAERGILERQGILSLLEVPVFVSGEWWGLIGFDDCAHEREWSQVEIDALRAAAGVLGAAIRRRLDEEHVREAESRFRSIVEHTPAVTYQEYATDEHDAASSILYVSPQAERILGYPTESWSQIPGFWTTLLHPEDAARVIEESERTSATGEPFAMDYRMLAADGRVVWFHDEAVLVRDLQGAPLLWQGVMVDITRQKTAEEQLREARTRYQALVEHLPAVVYREPAPWDPNEFYISPQSAEVFGYDPEEWRAGPGFWNARIHPEDRARVLEANALSDATGEPFSAEYRFRTRDGRYVWVQDGAALVRDDSGSPRYWQGFMLDITERKRAEEGLQQAEARYRTLVEQVPAAIYTQVIEAGSTVTRYISPRIRDILGYSAEEMIGGTGALWREIIHPDDRERVAAEDARTNATGEPFTMEYRVIAKDGSIVWIRDEASVVLGADGRPRFWQGLMLDVTDRKQAEEQLERALQVEREATERLRMLDEMKNTFLQAVSHDLRTPLAAILGLAVTLEREDVALDAPDARDMARRIAANARKLDRMVTDLLDLDRLARGIVEPKLRPTDVGALVRRAVAESDLVAQGRVQVSAPSIVASVDAAKLERIVENLLANTARHTPEDARVWVRVEPAAGGVLIVVEDDGPGVPEELREAIFEPFRQGPDPSSHSPGVGIGLALVARFAELLGGRAWVEPRTGGGASFRVLVADGRTGPGAADLEGGHETNDAPDARASGASEARRG